MIASLNDWVLLMIVGLLNFCGAILLAHSRTEDEGPVLASLPAPTLGARPEVAQG